MTIADLLPATAAEIIEATGRAHEDVYAELVRMEARGLARVQIIWGVRPSKNRNPIAIEWHPA